jgi:hypothetical protein
MSVLSPPPLPKEASEILRVEHSRLRRRIIYSMHEGDVKDRLVRSVGISRAVAWAERPDMSSNPAWYVSTQLAGLYREIPEVMPPDGAEEAAAAIAEAGWWQLAQRNQRDTIALNDGFVRVDVDPDTREASFRLVPPDMCKIVASPLRPSQPLALKEWIPDPDDQAKWVRLITDPRSRTYMAATPQGEDVSKRVLGGTFMREDYPFIVDGEPVLPYIAYHAAATGHALDPWTGREVFDGTLSLGVLYTYVGHVVRNVAWAQRWALGVEPAGSGVDADGNRIEVSTDPATLLMLAQSEGAGNPQIGQWNSPVSPTDVLSVAERYERRLVEMALGQTGVSRRESDVRSAMSLAVSRESQREAQRAYTPVFRRSDTRLCALVSGLMGLPTKGWRIRYKAIPRDAAEIKAELDRQVGQIEAGLLDRVTAYQQIHPGLTRAEAERAVADIAQVNRAYSL